MPKIESSESTHEEVDEVEEMLGRLGNYGIFGSPPSAEGLRSVYWVDGVNGSDTNDGTTASNARQTIDAGHNLLTANQDDVLLVLQASYDENASTTGVICDTALVHILGLGGTGCEVVNSNGAAISVFNITVSKVDLRGFFIAETTSSVEGVVVQGSGTTQPNGILIRDNLITGAMENGIHLDHNGTGNVTYCVVENNTIWNCTNDGIELSGITYNCTIEGNKIYNVGDNGINLNGDDVDACYVYKNIINGSAGTTDYAIQILLGDENIVANNWMAEVGTWPINSTGSDNGWVNNHYGGALTGSHDITTANDKTETTITGLDDLDLWTEGDVYISIDVQTLITAGEGGTITAYLKEKIDDTNYRIIYLSTFQVGTDVDHLTLKWGYEGGDSKARATIICSDDVTATRATKWKFKMV